MQLVITADTTATVTSEDATIAWVTKGGSSINSKDGRWALRKNSKGLWKVLDMADKGNCVAFDLANKDEAKAFALKLTQAATFDIRAAFDNGDAKVYSVRANGTMRRRHYLVGNELHEAQNVRDMRNDGASMAAIAGELHVSISHVRRMLVDLAITEQIQSAQDGELEAMLVGAAEVAE